MARLPDPTANLQGKAAELYEELVATRSRIDGMYRTLLNHPDLLEHISALGTFFRFGDSVLPGLLRETAILRVAQKLGAGYEWVKHTGPALENGLSPEIIEALRRGEIPPKMTTALRLTIKIVDCVLAGKNIPQGLQDDLIDETGLDGVIELVALCGFYQMIAGVIFAFDVPLPPGSEPPF